MRLLSFRQGSFLVAIMRQTPQTAAGPVNKSIGISFCPDSSEIQIMQKESFATKRAGSGGAGALSMWRLPRLELVVGLPVQDGFPVNIHLSKSNRATSWPASS